MKLNKAIGKMACMCCGELFTVKQSDTGTLALSCPDCDLSAYARPGTEAHRLAMKRITLRAPATPAPAPVVKAAPKPAPTPVVKAAPKPATPAPARPAMASLPVSKSNTLFG